MRRWGPMACKHSWRRGGGVCVGGWVDGSDPVCNQQVTRPPRHSRLSVEVKLVEALGASSKRDAVVSHAVAWHAAQQAEHPV